MEVEDYSKGVIYLIVKARNTPLRIKVNEAILRRLPPNHPKVPIVAKDLAKLKAGLKGEQETDYFLSFLPEDQYLIFQDVRLEDRGHRFQIDHLLLSPHFLLLLEVKNLSGTVTFNVPFNQIIRSLPDKEEGFEDPLLQAKRHRQQLREWAGSRRLPKLPIDFFVVFGKSGTILKNPSQSAEIDSKVCLAGSLPFKIQELANHYPERKLTAKKLKEWEDALLSHQVPATLSYSYYEIETDEYIQGVLCPDGHLPPMTRVSGNWVCATCGLLSKDSHIQAIDDFFLLIKPHAGNQEIRHFLQLSSLFQASRLLTDSHLAFKGSTRGRRYFPQSSKVPPQS